MANPCDTVQSIRTGDGVTTQFSFTFTYNKESEINVSLYDITTKLFVPLANDQWSLVNATTINFITAPPAVVDSAGNSIANVKIWRQTDIESLVAKFYPGSAIRAQDLNNIFEQFQNSIQEGNCRVPDSVFILFEDYWNKITETLVSTDSWVSSDEKVATTAAIQQYVLDNEDTGLPEAPIDGRQYARQDADWTVVIGGKGGLNYLGLIDATQAAPSASDGDFYVNTGVGNVAPSWTGIAGQTLIGGERLAYNGTEWSILPSEGGAVNIAGGVAISIDDTNPAEPIINLDINKLGFLP